MKVCPYCGDDEGYYENWVQQITYSYEFNGEYLGASDFTGARGGKRKYCIKCYRDITKYVKGER